MDYVQRGQRIPAVRGVSFSLARGRTLALVGESGCGKSTLALAVIGLLPPNESRIANGEIRLDGRNLLALDETAWRGVRGRRIAMIFQDPFSSLNPVMTVDEQIQEAIALEEGRGNAARARDLLAQVQLPDPDRIRRSYPHQISGGQRQRVIIAMALARKPELLIADEPTTALDVTVQDEIVKLLKNLQRDTGMALLFVTHNIGLVKGVSDEAAVMYAGQIVEHGPTPKVLSEPRHPYTQGLLRSLPTLAKTPGPLPVLEGQPPDPRAIPSGCPFHPRCERAFAPCPSEDPADRAADTRRVRCHLY